MASTLSQSPPSPKEKHWLFGSAYVLRKNAHLVLPELIKKYGEVISLSLPFTTIVIAANPEVVKYVLLENNKNYRKSLAYDMLKLLLGQGLLTSEGDFWKKQRKLIQPAFHKQKLADLTAMMVNRTSEEVSKLESAAQQGEYFDIVNTMTALTLDIISQAIFSDGITDKSELVSKQITMLNQYATEKLNQPIRLPASVPTPGNIKQRKSIKILDDIIFSIIDKRRKEGISKSDLLSMLVDARDDETGEEMDKQQLRDEIMTIFIAGNETTANAMSWTLYLLSQNPDAQQKMMHEIDEKLDSGVALTFETIMQFQYVRQVIDESLRIYPPAWIVGRRNLSDDEIGGYKIAKNTNVLMPILYLHHCEKYWDEPSKFKPERFAPEHKNKIDRYVYLPFGGGPRFCIGNNFAILEMQIILILLYRNYTFELDKTCLVEVEPLITLRPKNGIKMRAVKR